MLKLSSSGRACSGTMAWYTSLYGFGCCAPGSHEKGFEDFFVCKKVPGHDEKAKMETSSFKKVE